MAAAWHLPVIFVCENNGIACSTPHKTGGQQAVMDLSKRALGYGMDSYVVNGNDFFEVYDGMQRLASVLAMARVIAVASLNARHIVLSATS